MYATGMAPGMLPGMNMPQRPSEMQRMLRPEMLQRYAMMQRNSGMMQRPEFMQRPGEYHTQLKHTLLCPTLPVCLYVNNF